QWNRESLYEEVWQSPVSKVAEKYGISDVAIAKVCRKLKIPVPGRGYWARKSAGYSLRRQPLPPFKNAPVLYRAVRTRPPKLPNDPSDPELLQIAAVEAKNLPNPASEHSLIEEARKQFLRAKPDEYGRLESPSSKRCVDIHVSAELLDRALSVMNTLLFALEEEGLEVSVTEKSTSVVAFGQTVRFGIAEDLQVKERREVQSYSGKRMVNVYERSGRIAFHVLSNAKGQRAFWGDGRTKKLEQLLPKCIGGIFRHARLNRIEDEKRKEREAEWERQRLEHVERERREREEQKRFENLEHCVSSWKRAKHIREFIEAYEFACEKKGESTDPESERGKWIQWAREKADWLDPLSRI
ncbi:MAG: hypothetical protein ABSA85_05980, partial [Terracidiphilus sp.]